MKKIISTLILAAGLFSTAHAQYAYIYSRDKLPIKIEDSKFDLQAIDAHPFWNSFCGTYNATAESAFAGEETQRWSATVSRDYMDGKDIVWIQPICEIGGLSANSINPVYGIVNIDSMTLTIPYGQCLYGGPESTYNMIIAGLSSTPITEGYMTAKISCNGDSCSFVINNDFGVGDINADVWWYQALQAPITFCKAPTEKHSLKKAATDSTDQADLNILISEIDSISTTRPVLKLESAYPDSDTPSLFNLVFNYPTDKDAGSFQTGITYKAYDENNNLVKTGQAGYLSRYNTTLNILLCQVDSDYYIIPDSFLPCDTTFKVAVSLPDAFYTDIYGNTMEAIDSYIDPDGTEHGFCFSYYSKRPKLLSNGLLQTNPDNKRQAYLEFNTPVNFGRYPSYKLYKRTGSGAELVSNGQLSIYDRTWQDSTYIATIGLPDSINFVENAPYIVTVSIDKECSVGNGYNNINTLIDSYVDADGTTHGLWWELTAEAPYITSVSPITASNRGRTATISFNEQIVRGDGAIGYNVYDANLNVLFNGAVNDSNLVVASGKDLTVTLPESVAFADSTQYIVVLSFEEGAVTNIYGNKMAAVAGGVDGEGMPFGLWWQVYNSSSQDTGFIKEGNYLFSFTWENQQGSQALASAAAFEYIGTYDMSQILQSYAGITAHQWSISNFLTEVGLTPTPFNAFAYVNTVGSEQYNWLDLMSPDLELLQVGTVMLQGETTPAPVYLANLVQEADGNYIYPVVSFAELQGQIFCISEQPVLVTPSGGQYGIIAYLNDMMMTPAGEATVADAASVARQIEKLNMATARKASLNAKRAIDKPQIHITKQHFK